MPSKYDERASSVVQYGAMNRACLQTSDSKEHFCTYSSLHLACSRFFSFYRKSTGRLCISKVFYVQDYCTVLPKKSCMSCYWRPEIRVNVGGAKL